MRRGTQGSVTRAIEREKMSESDKPKGVDPEANREDRINREELLKRLSKRQGDLRLDRETLSKDRERLLGEVQSLEDESYALASQTKELQSQLLERRKTAQRVYQRSQEMRKKMLQFLAEENNLIHEVRFLESEKDTNSREYRNVSARVSIDMASIAAMLRDIEFMRGELEILIGQSGNLESGVPEKYRDIDRLDEKISGSLDAMVDLYNKVKAVEKNTKVIFYRREKGITRSFS